MDSAVEDLHQAGIIWMANLDETRPVVSPLIPVEFSRAAAQHGPALANAMGNGSPDEVVGRLATGRSGYLAWIDGQIAAYGWVSFDEEFIGEMNLHLRLLPGEAYLWDCATLPAFRQKRLFSALLVYMLHDLQAEAVCRAWIGANLENEASQRGIARAGFRRVADLEASGSLARRTVRLSGRPGVPESLVQEARRAFLGDLQEVKVEKSL